MFANVCKDLWRSGSGNTALQDWVLLGQVRPVGGSVSLPKVTDLEPGPARLEPETRPFRVLGIWFQVSG